MKKLFPAGAPVDAVDAVRLRAHAAAAQPCYFEDWYALPTPFTRAVTRAIAQDGYTALHLAASNDFPQVISELIAAGAARDALSEKVRNYSCP